MSLYSHLRRELLRIAVNLARLIENPGEYSNIRLKVLTQSYESSVAEAARSALEKDPQISPLLKERYWGAWHEMATFSRMPEGTLGKELAKALTSLGDKKLPDPIIQSRMNGDDEWLHLRLRHTHDIWHVITGFPTTPAGEAALHAFMVMQLRWPGSVLLLGAYLMERCLKGPSPDNVDVGIAVAFGLQLGYRCAPLAAQRWENGWERYLSDWRKQLGIAELLKQSPFNQQPQQSC